MQEKLLKIWLRNNTNKGRTIDQLWYNGFGIWSGDLLDKSEFNVVGENMNADFRINGKVIETERLILRPFRQTDLEDFYEYAENLLCELSATFL